MNAFKDHDDREVLLWRQYSSQQDQQSFPEVDANLLAAYLEGRADAAEREQLEARLAHDPELLEALVELRQLQDAEPATVSQTLLERIKNLLPAEASQPRRISRAGSTWWRRAGNMAAAAGIFLACVGGYMAGGSSFRDQTLIQTSVASEESMELGELVFEPTLALIMQSNGTNGGE